MLGGICLSFGIALFLLPSGLGLPRMYSVWSTLNLKRPNLLLSALFAGCLAVVPFLNVVLASTHVFPFPSLAIFSIASSFSECLALVDILFVSFGGDIVSIIEGVFVISVFTRDDIVER